MTMGGIILGSFDTVIATTKPPKVHCRVSGAAVSEAEAGLQCNCDNCTGSHDWNKVSSGHVWLV
jgi:hypothetical protein